MRFSLRQVAVAIVLIGVWTAGLASPSRVTAGLVFVATVGWPMLALGVRSPRNLSAFHVGYLAGLSGLGWLWRQVPEQWALNVWMPAITRLFVMLHPDKWVEYTIRKTGRVVRMPESSAETYFMFVLVFVVASVFALIVGLLSDLIWPCALRRIGFFSRKAITTGTHDPASS